MSLQNILERPYFSYLSMKEELLLCQKRAEKIKSQARIVFVGVGGSSLGVRALCSFLGLDHVTVADNLDEASLKTLRFEGSVHWIIASKSGTTMETLGMLNQLLQSEREFSAEDFTVITSNVDSPLGRWAGARGVEILRIPEQVGGRFSVYSPIGFLPLALAGFSLEDIAEDIGRCAVAEEDLDAFTGFLRRCCEEKKGLLPVWSYGSRIYEAGLWFQQLWSESLGKKITDPSMSVPVPIVCRGASDQHSLLQQFFEQPQGKAHFFLQEDFYAEPELKEDLLFPDRRLKGRALSEVLNMEAEACREALAEVGALTYAWSFSGSIGSLLRFFTFSMIAVDRIAADLRVNAFDQPGVERCKVLIHQKLLSQ